MIRGMLAVEVENRHRPAEILANLNRQLFRRGIAPRFATLFLGALSPTGRFVYANAGHNSPIVLTRNGFQRLTIGGTILGAFSESTFEEGTVALSEGDSMIMFSDGVTEASDVHDQEFGEDRLLSYLAAVGDDAPTSVLRGILGSVREFCDGAAQSDDITAAVIRFHRS
jgi:sigma-B regulation protein RsbU (phosphoserine phosphatase)